VSAGAGTSAGDEHDAGALNGRRGKRFMRLTAPAAALFLTFGANASAEAQQPESNVSGNPCLQCHEGIETQAGTWNGRRFTHTPHLERANLDCTFCHTAMEQHGGMKLEGVAACNDCHHNRSSGASCSVCHAVGTGAPQGIIAHEVGDFDHARHGGAGLPCTTCHTGSTMSASQVDCVACHAVHHQPESSCLACHRAGTTPQHPTEVHVAGCTGCHGETSGWIDTWTRETCAVCHTGREEHYPERPCVLCHIVPSIPVPGGG